MSHTGGATGTGSSNVVSGANAGAGGGGGGRVYPGARHADTTLVWKTYKLPVREIIHECNIPVPPGADYEVHFDGTENTLEIIVKAKG